MDWTRMPDRELLQMRICDLELDLESTWLYECVCQVWEELAIRGLRFRPHAWLSDEWYCPDGIPGIAIPFYLSHPRLARLEKSQMLEVEGGTRTWCLKIIRHEIGHAFDTAYRLHRRKRYRELFGRYNEPYPDTYRPDPNSRDYVNHLEPWYAQSHPAEDFAETFAVWLKPKSNWWKQYRDWPAIHKLNLVDELFAELVNRKPAIASRKKIDPVNRLKVTLGEYYRQKRAHYGFDRPSCFDDELFRLFGETSNTSNRKTAAAFLQKQQAELARIVCTWTGEYHYNVKQVLREMIDRCRELGLRVNGDEAVLKQNALAMLTVQAVNLSRNGSHRVAL